MRGSPFAPPPRTLSPRHSPLPRLKDSTHNMSTTTEQVLVVPTEVFRRVGYFQGFCGDAERYLEQLLRPEWMSYQPRGAMEQDPNYKQLIPYVIFRCQNESGRPLLFAYTRGSGQGETRLHRKRSIGIGGHISSDDGSAVGHENVYREGLRRELEEEVIIDTAYREKCVGLINDDQTEVGTVHLGVVHIFDVDRPLVRAREADIADASFVPVDQLIEQNSEFESWSQICLEALFQ